MRTDEALVETLIKRQRELGETDFAFAGRIKMSRQTWQLIRTGGLAPSSRTLQGVAQAFPDLMPDVMAFLLARNASRLTDDSNTLAEAKTS